MSHLITHATPRAQSGYGRFQPRADQKKFGVLYAAVDGGATGFPHMEEVKNEGVSIAHGAGSLRYDEYVGPDGRTHDVTLPSGQKVREMICPIEEVRQKEAMEARASQDMVDNYEERKGIKSRLNDDGRVHLSSQITERVTAQTFTPHDPETQGRLKAALTVKGGWTPERKAAHSAKIKAHNAQKAASKPTIATT